MRNRFVIRLKNNMTEWVQKRDYLSLFCVLMVLSLSISFAIDLICGGKIFSNWITPVRTNVTMDFYNSIRVLGAKDRNPYTNYATSYPPLALIFYYVMGMFLPTDLQTDLEKMPGTSLSAMLYLISLLVLSVLQFEIVSMQKTGAKNVQRVFGVLSLFTVGMIWNYERGNIIVISLILTMFFMFYWESENKVVSELAMISLALAAGLKIYPAVFGLLVLHKREYKKVCRLVIYGILAIIVPFFAFEGITAIPIFFKALAGISNRGSVVDMLGGISLSGIVKTLLIWGGWDCTYLPSAVQKIAYIVLILVCILIHYYRQEWKRVTALTLMMLIVPGLSLEYVLMFMIIPLVFFLKEKNHAKLDVIYFISMCLLCIPLPLFNMTSIREMLPINRREFSVSQLIWQMALLFLLILLLAEGVVRLVEEVRKSKRVSAFVSLMLCMVLFVSSAFVIEKAVSQTIKEKNDIGQSAIATYTEWNVDANEIVFVAGNPARIYDVKEKNGMPVLEQQELYQNIEQIQEKYAEDRVDIIISRKTLDGLRDELCTSVKNDLKSNYRCVRKNNDWYCYQLREERS